MTDQSSNKRKASIKAEFGPDGPTSYRAGHVDDEGNFEDDALILSVEDVQQAVFNDLSFTIMGETTGVLLPCPLGIAEGLLDQMFSDDRLKGRPVDEVVFEALDLSMNEASNTMIVDLTQLRDRLQLTLARVEAELAHHRAMQSKHGKSDAAAETAKGRRKDDMH